MTNIVVLIKQVPDTWSERKLSDGDFTLDREAADAVLDEINERAVEEALLIKERDGGEVTVLTAGPDRATDAIRKALSMGADKAVHINDPALHGSDAVQTAWTLAAALGQITFENEEPADLIIAGNEATDGRVGAVEGRVVDVHCLVGTHGQGLADGVGGAVRTCGEDGHLAALSLLDQERFLDGALVDLVEHCIGGLAVKRVVTVGQLALGPRVGDLLDQNNNVRHGSSSTSCVFLRGYRELLRVGRALVVDISSHDGSATDYPTLSYRSVTCVKVSFTITAECAFHPCDVDHLDERPCQWH